MDDPKDSTAPAVKDEEAEHLIASAWRPALREIVAALAAGDYFVKNGVGGVTPVSVEVAEQMREYVSGYGEMLVELPEDTWQTSVSQWMGTHWDLLVDLWTDESGASDMVLQCRVFEAEGGFRIDVYMVYVP